MMSACVEGEAGQESPGGRHLGYGANIVTNANAIATAPAPSAAAEIAFDRIHEDRGHCLTLSQLTSASTATPKSIAPFGRSAFGGALCRAFGGFPIFWVRNNGRKYSAAGIYRNDHPELLLRSA